MSEQWFRDYVMLQFRMDKAIRKFTQSRFVDFYYGPSEWKASVEVEGEMPALDLVRAANALLDTLSTQGFEAHRARYLEKQVIALETVCRKLNGETFPLADETERCFDILPTWIPETQFEEAHALLDEALPGEGSIHERRQRLRRRYELAGEQRKELINFMRQAMLEARRRTLAFIDLPQGEEVDLALVSNQVFGGENWYLGNYHSHVEMNTDIPTDMRWLMDLVSHEGYPGHHTEFALKEQYLYRERGYIEQSISPIISPQSVISEGIATSALDMIFTRDEAEQWAVSNLYPVAGIKPIEVDHEKMARASELMASVEGNARFMLSDGRPENEVKDYLMKYSLIPEHYAENSLAFLKDPFREAYIFTYFYGKKLMKPWLAGSDKQVAFKRLLTEQLCPSDLQAGKLA
jgi:hypothetical protein